MKAFKVGQRIKRGLLRGTVTAILVDNGMKHYFVKLDNGVFAKGTIHQFQPVKRS